MLKQTHYITLCYSSLCIGFGWQRAKITTSLIISNILRHTHTHKRWKLNQGIKLLSALFTRLCKKFSTSEQKFKEFFRFSRHPPLFIFTWTWLRDQNRKACNCDTVIFLSSQPIRGGCQEVFFYHSRQAMQNFYFFASQDSSTELACNWPYWSVDYPLSE